jgi:raffinose/stachyose/melibiose transport system permease protein
MATTFEVFAKKIDRSTGRIAQYLILILVSILILGPIVLSFVGGLKTNGQLLAHPFAIPHPVMWSNYSNVLTGSSFWRQVGNSALVMVATTLLVLALASTSAFVFARFTFQGREAIFTYFTLGLLFPASVAILPLYILIRQLGLVDTMWGVILPQVAFQLPISILILRNFFIAIPRELEDAAYVDGATTTEFFLRILLPLSRPGLSAVAVLTMVLSWNNYFLPLVVLNSEKNYTLPLGVMQYQGQFSSDWGAILAFLSLAMVPAIIFYLFAERQIIAGLTAGAVKG